MITKVDILPSRVFSTRLMLSHLSLNWITSFKMRADITGNLICWYMCTTKWIKIGVCTGCTFFIEDILYISGCRSGDKSLPGQRFGELLTYHLSLNSSPPSAAYMRQLIGSALGQIIACHLFGTKSQSEPMLGFYQLDPWEQTSVKF